MASLQEIRSELADVVAEALEEAAATPAPITTLPSPTPSPTPIMETDVEFQRVGAEGFGFVSIPAFWVEFLDIGIADSPVEIDILQFSDPLGMNIITMQYSSTIEHATLQLKTISISQPCIWKARAVWK